MAAIEIWKHIE